jgi:hypothetical protein
MSWYIPDFMDMQLTQSIIKGDYAALKASVAQRNAKIRIIGQDGVPADDNDLFCAITPAHPSQEP